MRIQLIGCLLLCSLMFACQTDHLNPKRAFYHWKTHYSPSALEVDRLDDLAVDRLYLKYFDVAWDNGANMAVPQAKISFGKSPKQEVVPTVYVTNEAIRKTGEKGAKTLADKVHQLILDRHPATLPQPKEIQIDCDWTQSTRAAYFEFLDRLAMRLDSQNIQLSATIRLHQIKFHKKTGVPPVDRGMLMFYNMGNLDDANEENSILNVAEGKKYIDKLNKYPLPLDAALPIFSWAVLIRQGKPFKLLNNLRIESVERFPWVHEVGGNVLEIDSSHYLKGHYLYPGDRIRFEAVEHSSLLEAASLLQSKLANSARHISLYHLDSATIIHYPKPQIEAVFTTFE